MKYLSLIIMLLFSSSDWQTQYRSMEEICDNAKDDDNDGLIDLNDPDCVCEEVNLESLFPNPSFEEFTCCPESYSQFSCLTGWEQASGGSTDYINTCDYLAEGKEMLPFPDGDGAVLFLSGKSNLSEGSTIYNEYAGACLTRPMLKDSVYKLKFHVGFLDPERSPEFKLSFYGSPSCSNIPFSSEADCPTNYPDWYFLKSEIIGGDSQTATWVEVSSSLQASFDMNAIVIGADCDVKSSGMLKIYFLDNLRLNTQESFDFERIDAGNPCDPDFVFEVKDSSIFEYQWYKEGEALLGESDAKLSQMYGEGNYQLRITNKNTMHCRIAQDFEFYIPTIESQIYRSICLGESFEYNGQVINEGGSYEFTHLSASGCDSVSTLIVKIENEVVDTIYAQILKGTSYSIADLELTEEGEYLVNMPGSLECEESVLVSLKHINAYVPNAFSPNGDNVNDYFEVFTNPEQFISKHIKIYDRWGNLLFEGEKWDGRSRNELLDPGVYTYVLRLTDLEGKELIVTNSVTLLR